MMNIQDGACTSTTKKIETLKIKKERLDSANDPTNANQFVLVSENVLPQYEQLQNQERLSSNKTSSLTSMPVHFSKDTNGIQAVDLLQDVLKSKFSNVSQHNFPTKHEKIRLMIEDSISEESRCQVQEIFKQIDRLKLEEKLLLYLKLPISLTSANGTVDPLRQPLNPLGNRCEIHQTIMWIKTHLEEDLEVSLPKQEVYDEYNLFCVKNCMKPLSTADFGKVMKQVYPKVRPRRLGTRGNSRYCYSGMRKRLMLDPPILPKEKDDSNDREEMLGAASSLIREWAETLLNKTFPTLCSLGKYLVKNLCVDNRSLAAICILSDGNEEDKIDKPGTALNSAGKTGKLREAQLQLQKKLQNRENLHNTKIQDSSGKKQNKNNSIDYVNNECSNGNSKKSKKGKGNLNHHLTRSTNTLNNISSIAASSHVTSSSSSPSQQKAGFKNNSNSIYNSNNNSNKQTCSNIPLQSSVCDNLEVQSIQDPQSNSAFCSTNKYSKDLASKIASTNCSISPKKEVCSKSGKKSRKRSTNSGVESSDDVSESSPEKQFKLVESMMENYASINDNQQSNKDPLLLLSNGTNGGRLLSDYSTKISKVTSTTLTATVDAVSQTSNSCDNKDYVSLTEHAIFESSFNLKNIGTKSAIVTTASQLSKKNRQCQTKLNNIESDAINDYLNGGNSQEQEEELMQYFQQSNSSSSDMDISNSKYVTNDDTAILGKDCLTTATKDKVSQLRIILEENLKEDSVLAKEKRPCPTLGLQTIIIDDNKKNPIQVKHSKNNATLTALTQDKIKNFGNTKRRVSFENSVIDCTHEYGSSANNLIGVISISNNNNINNNSSHTANNNSSINNTVPQSPNTRRRIFNFTPISPGPQSPINIRYSKSNSASASPFLSPRNTPVPRSKSNLQGAGTVASGGGIINQRVRSNAQKTVSRSISCNVPCLSSANDVFIVPSNSLEVSGRQTVQVASVQNLSCPPIFNDLASQEPLLINYPSQENLQEIKNTYNNNSINEQQMHQLTDQEISNLLQSEKQKHVKEQLFYRSQSVPLHRMVNPALLSPVTSLTGIKMTPPIIHRQHSHQLNQSCSSSIAQTPIPSEFNDFDSIDTSSYLLDVNSELVAEEQQFLIGDKDILDILSQDQQGNLMSPNIDEPNKQILGTDSPLLNASTSNNLLNADMDPWAQNNIHSQKIMQSRSYPNTPLPIQQPRAPVYSSSSSVINGNSSKSYPSTPLHITTSQNISHAESKEPMLFNPLFNTVNLRNQLSVINNKCSTANVECNVADLLDSDIIKDSDHDTDDLGTLEHFGELPDVDVFAPLLFTEVVETNQ